MQKIHALKPFKRNVLRAQYAFYRIFNEIDFYALTFIFMSFSALFILVFI